MALLTYDVSIVGESKVYRALDGIERRFIQHGKRLDAIVGRASSGTASRTSARGPRDPRAAKDNALRGFEEIGRAARAAEYKRGRDEISSAKRVERERIASEKRVAAARVREERRTQSQAERAQKQRERVAMRHAAAEARESHRYRQTFARGLGARLSNVGSTLGSIGSAAAGGAALVGGFAVGSKIQKEVELEQRIRQLRIAGRGPGQAGVRDEEIRGLARNTSIATGVSENDAVAGMQAFVTKTGDLQTAMSNLKNFATIAKATGGSVEDVASAAADLKEKFDLSKPDEMAEALAGLAFQGKKGAFELRDMAAQFPKMAAAAQRFGFKGAAGVKELGGMAQIARSATGSGEQAASAVEATLRQIGTHGKDLASGAVLGKKVDVGFLFDPKKKQRRASDVITDIISAGQGNIPKLQQIFGEEGIRGVAPLISSYREASAKAGGGAAGDQAGRAAVEAKFKDAIEAGGNFKDAQQDAADALKTTASQLEILNTKIQEALGSKLLPAFNRMLPSIERLIPALGKLADGAASMVNWLAENPWKGLGLIVAGVIGKELLGAGIGAAIRRAIENSGRPRVPGAGGAPGEGGAGGPGGGGKTTLGGALTAAGVGYDIGAATAGGITALGIGTFHATENIATEGGKANLYMQGGAKDRDSLVKNVEQQKNRLLKMDPTKADTAQGSFLKAMESTNIVAYGLKKLVIDPARSGAVRTQETNVQNAEKMLADFDAKTAGDQFKTAVAEAGKAFAQEVVKSGAGPNRSDSPTQPRSN